MTTGGRSGRRGQPIVALSLLLVTWAGARAVAWSGTDRPDSAAAHTKAPGKIAASSRQQDLPAVVLAGTRPAPVADDAGRAGSVLDAVRLHRAPVPVAAPVWRDAPIDSNGHAVPLAPAGSFAPQPVSPRIAGGHQMLWLAALAQLPMPDLPPHAVPLPVPAGSAGSPRPSRWSADGWLMLRRCGTGFNLPGGGLAGGGAPSAAYGASQAGAVVRYRLAPSSPNRPALYARVTSGLQSPRGEEFAGGLSARPIARVPASAMVEVRATRTASGTVLRPALAVVSEVPPIKLPQGFRAEVYAQAGYVGGRFATGFVDGQGRLERRIAGAGRWELRAGAGAWGGAQKGAGRIDVGPTATLALPLGSVGSRVSADWRFRVAGNAVPTSGPAITLSAGF